MTISLSLNANTYNLIHRKALQQLNYIYYTNPTILLRWKLTTMWEFMDKVYKTLTINLSHPSNLPQNASRTDNFTWPCLYIIRKRKYIEDQTKQIRIHTNAKEGIFYTHCILPYWKIHKIPLQNHTHSPGLTTLYTFSTSGVIDSNIEGIHTWKWL